MDRFWIKVDIRGPDECWEWKAGLFADGYGAFGVNGKVLRAHRFSYELTNGPIPNNLYVLHSCHNRKCVNPTHLRAGTAADNTADMVGSHRNKRGEETYNSKLCADDVRKIKNLLISGNSRSSIAAQFNVSPTTIFKIKSNQTWRHVS